MKKIKIKLVCVFIIFLPEYLCIVECMKENDLPWSKPWQRLE